MNAIVKSTFVIAVAVAAAPFMSMPVAWSDPGDLNIIRKVEPRSAFREGSGPVAAKVNAAKDITTAPGLDQSRGGPLQRELSDGEFAAIVSGIPQSATAGLAASRQPGASAAGGAGMASYGVAAGGAISRALGVGGGGGGGGAGAVTRQATDQLVDALKGAGLVGR